MAEARILRIDSLPVFERGNGIQTIPLATREIGSKQMTTGLTRFPAGAKVPLHSHNCDEQVTIIEGFDASVDVAVVAKELKEHLGTGGTSKEGRIELQGDHRKAVRAHLEHKGYRLES